VTIDATTPQAFALGSDAVSLAGNVTLSALNAINNVGQLALKGASDTAKSSTKQSLDFAHSANQPGGGVAVDLAKWGALAVVGVAGVVIAAKKL